MTEDAQDSELADKHYLIAVESVTRDAIRMSPAVISENGVREAARNIVKLLKESGLLKC